MLTRAGCSLWLALGAILAGCGGDTGPASVTVSTASGPLPGASVVFHDANGEPTALALTAADGRASAEVKNGAMITVLLEDRDQRYRATFTGVKPGDELKFASPRIVVTEVGTASVTMGGYPGAAVYVFYAACASVYTANVSRPVEIDVRSNCLSRDGTFYLLVCALDADGNMLAQSAVRDVPWTDRMKITMPAWSDMATYEIQGSDLPAGALGFTVQVAHEVDEVLIGYASKSILLEPGSSGALALQYAPGFADRLHTETTVIFGEDLQSIDGVTTIVERTATLPAGRPYDLSGDFLPRIHPPVYDATDPARLALSVTGDASMKDTDGGALSFAWSTQADGRQSWVVLVPPDVGSPVKLPALPDALASWAPKAGVKLEKAQVRFLDAGWVGSYDELRNGMGVAFMFGQAGMFPDRDAILKVTTSL